MSYTNNKLSPKYFGPHQVLNVIGKVAYKLKLQEDDLIHPLFHLSRLKAFRGDLLAFTHIPSWLHDKPALHRTTILVKRMMKHQNAAHVENLI